MRWETNHQFVQQGTHAVDVSSFVVSNAFKDLGAHILGAAAEGEGSLLLWDHFAQAKVSDFDVAIDINKDVLRLDVPVDNVQAVNVLKSLEQLAEVELGLLLRKLLDLA